MQIRLPKLHQAQKTILEANSRFIVVMCGRRFGKSELSQVKIITTAIEGKRVAYITPTYKLAKTFFDKLIQKIPFPNNRSELTIDFPNDGRVEFYTGERLDNLRGRKFHLVVIDEACYVNNLEHGWLNSIRPTLTDYSGDAWFLSTPRGKDFFYSLFMKGKGDKDWLSFKFSTYDNPHINPSEIDDAKEQLPFAVFAQEYLADPMENAANPFGIEHIRNCIRPLKNSVPAYYGIDLAKSVDYTVIIGLDREGNCCYFERYQKDWKHTKEHILQLQKNVPTLIDSTGVGDAITEDLQRSFHKMEGYKYTSNSKQQLMEVLASYIHQQKVFFPDGIIVDELTIFEYQYTSNGVKYNAPSGFHDDCVNALALAVRCMDKHKNVGIYHFI